MSDNEGNGRDRSVLSSQKSEEIVIQKFEGVCPECGQPFLAEIVDELEKTVVKAIESIKSLEIILQLKNGKIKELETKKLVLVQKRIEISKN